MKPGKTCFLLFAVAAVLLIAGSGPGRAGREVFRRALIVHGQDAASAEVHAASQLARDLTRVCGVSARVISEKEWAREGKARKGAAVFFVGTAETSSRIKALVERGAIEVSAFDPGPEAFVVKSFPAAGEVCIAGCDQRGTLYGVYWFSGRYLGVDPMEFWTGKAPAKLPGLQVPEIDHRASPPAFALRGYFDNDSDMLANWRGEKLKIEFETWKEMIDSVARLGYNFIDLFDTMGRTEFWVWPYYTEKFPGYHTDLYLVNRVIDYAHEKGMLVQVSTYLGYEFHHLPYEKRCLSLYHDDWIEAYRYLIENTPWGKADIFYHSPRDPWWDRPYRCPREKLMGISPGKLHTRLIKDLHKLIREHNPQARLMCLFWSDGKKHWESGEFDPGEGVDLVWSDDGYGRFPSWPDDFRGHAFGIYIHAGFWKNHVMQDPYPGRIAESTLEAYRRGMDSYYFVNGQDFKHFILNLEACGRVAWDPEGFDPEEFYQKWAGRYFGEDAAPKAVESLKALHAANDLAGGFADLTMKTKIYLKLVKYGTPYCRDFSYIDPALAEARRSLDLAHEARELVPEGSLPVFDDQVLFPAEIYLANLKLHAAVSGVIDSRCRVLDPLFPPGGKAGAWKEIGRDKRDAYEALAQLLELFEAGSGWEKWDGWTRVENFRKYEPPPTMEDLTKALGERK